MTAPRKCVVQPSRHAKRRALERGLSAERIEEIVFRGTKSLIGGRKTRHVLGEGGAIVASQPCHHLVVTVCRRS